VTGHRRFQVLAASAVDFDLVPDEAADLESHLRSCPECREVARRLSLQAESLRTRPRATPPAQLRHRVMADRTLRGPTLRDALRIALVVGLLGAAVVSLALLGAGASQQAIVTPSPRASTAATPPLRPSPTPAIGTVEERFAVDAGAGAHAHLCIVVTASDCAADLVQGIGSLWLTRSNGIVRVDPATGRVEAEIPVGAFPHRILIDGDALWATVQEPGRVVRVDTGSNTVVATVDVGGQPFGISGLGGSIWVADETSGDVIEIEPATATVVKRFHIGRGLMDLAAVDGALWVTNDLDGSLARLDPTTGDVRTSYEAPGDPVGLEADGTHLLIAGHDTIERLDATDGSSISALAANLPSIAVGDDAVWSASAWNQVLQQHDPETLAVVAEQRLSISDPNWSVAIAVGPDAVWIWTYTDDQLVRIDRTPSP
jgi:streptogramin lyase